jgi:hypothetical protein
LLVFIRIGRLRFSKESELFSGYVIKNGLQRITDLVFTSRQLVLVLLWNWILLVSHSTGTKVQPSARLYNGSFALSFSYGYYAENGILPKG